MATVGLFRHQYCRQMMESNIVRKIVMCDGEKCETMLLTNHNVRVMMIKYYFDIYIDK